MAEQQNEVIEGVQVLGRLPVSYLQDHAQLDENWTLIHATHMTRGEISTTARSGAAVCVCPTTEANLGDGVFSGREFLVEFDGRLAIGGDSHVTVNPCAELRMLEYSQRLSEQKRAILCDEARSVGRFLCDKVSASGNSVTGLNVGSIEIGKQADFAVIDQPEFLLDLPTDRLLDYTIFNEFQLPIVQSICRGKLIHDNN